MTCKASAFGEWLRPRRRALVISASLVALVATAFYLTAAIRDHRDSDVEPLVDVPVAEQTPVLDPDPAATVASRGDLILDALPWGRVVAIVSQDGEEQDLGKSLFTPARLSLPAGSYRVVLENPAVEEPAEFWVQVSPSVVRTRVHRFAPLDADSYFERVW